MKENFKKALMDSKFKKYLQSELFGPNLHVNKVKGGVSQSTTRTLATDEEGKES